ncbi:hypothetical protein BKA67DRAFT_577951 [Truncatella angustata]|uniref:Zn(2)-C6 fungal-type domain-containing protein n=1 Tax=Truncatella angustata TaxID=152316 RepID=A0A9P8RQK4_9PEZI|nr:uncharacterized protein BKA67DRAFT_577951 [Truncatella angustata]KAH6647593.1 hypothetical protein BKA67DRAFT_577951 [Truncatella angustata]
MSGGLDQQHNRCALCSKTFRQKSSLVRHAKKCTLEPKPSVRQKACKSCTTAKARCDLVRPTCSRCVSRGFTCTYIRPLPPPVTSSGSDSAPTEARVPLVAHHHNSFSSHDAAVTVYDFTDLDPTGTLTPGFFSSSEDGGVDIPSFLDPGAIASANLELLHTTPNPGPPPPPTPEGIEQLLQAVSKQPTQDRDAVLKHTRSSVPGHGCSPRDFNYLL